MENKYNNRASLWAAESKDGKTKYFKGEVIIDNKKYKISLFNNVSDKETAPVLTGMVELADK